MLMALGKKTVSESGGISLSRPIAPARGQQLKQVVSGAERVPDDVFCPADVSSGGRLRRYL